MTADNILRKLREFTCDSLYNEHSSLRTVNMTKINKIKCPTD